MLDCRLLHTEFRRIANIEGHSGNNPDLLLLGSKAHRTFDINFPWDLPVDRETTPLDHTSSQVKSHMPYIARTSPLSGLALSGGLIDPRAGEQSHFDKRMNCQDITDLISNPEISPLKSKNEMVGTSPNTRSMPRRKPGTEYQAKFDKILSCSRKIGLSSRKKSSDQPLSDLVPGLITCGGLSRSPAFDCLPVVSHWGDRTGETSAEDPNATVSLASTWGTTHLIGEGTTMACPLGAPCWSLKTHGIRPVEAGSSKFSQEYHPETDTLTTTVNLARHLDTAQTGGIIAAASSISWMRNTRVADTVDCAIGSLADVAVILAARDKVFSTGKTEHLPFAEVRGVEMPSWCSARKPLPPKLSGVAFSPDQATIDVIKSQNCEGPMLNTSIFFLERNLQPGHLWRLNQWLVGTHGLQFCPRLLHNH